MALRERETYVEEGLEGGDAEKSENMIIVELGSTRHRVGENEHCAENNSNE